MLRSNNATDFWRGYALVTIFITHVPQNFYFQFTHRNFGFSDSAELFVFLAGLGLHKSISRPSLSQSTSFLIWYLSRRAMRIYVAQILIISLAIAMLGGASLVLDNPLLTTWNNAEAAFYDPVRANVGFALLSYHIGYFDILPLYVALTLAAPAVVLIDRTVPHALFPVSLAIYASALFYELNLPTWPVDGQWFFNPLAWQLMFVLGYLYSRGGAVVRFIDAHSGAIRVIAVPLLVFAAFAEWNSWLPDPTAAPEPRLFFIDYKTFETPLRILHFLALAIVLSSAFGAIKAHAPLLSRGLCLLGRNSLSVFCLGSLLSLAGQITRYVLGGSIAVDSFILIAGVAAMLLTAWLAEWPQARERSR